MQGMAIHQEIANAINCGMPLSPRAQGYEPVVQKALQLQEAGFTVVAEKPIKRANNDHSNPRPDVVAWNQSELIVIDIKTGITPVQVENNSQLLDYASMLLNQKRHLTGVRVWLGIFQLKVSPNIQWWSPRSV